MAFVRKKVKTFKWPVKVKEPSADRAGEFDTFEFVALFKRVKLSEIEQMGDDSGLPLQYVVESDGRWTMNCFSCHGGSVYGEPTPGAPNNRFALQTLTEEIGKAKMTLGLLPGRMELGAMFIPLGTTNGTTNAVVFGMGLMDGRDEQLNLVPKFPK